MEQLAAGKKDVDQQLVEQLAAGNKDVDQQLAAIRRSLHLHERAEHVDTVRGEIKNKQYCLNIWRKNHLGKNNS